MKKYLIVGFCLIAAYVSAASTKTISGTVTDLTGHPLSKATVIVENKITHASIILQSDQDGRFVARNLKGSNYSVSVISDVETDGVRLQLDQAKWTRGHNRHDGKSLQHRAATKHNRELQP